MGAPQLFADADSQAAISDLRQSISAEQKKTMAASEKDPLLIEIKNESDARMNAKIEDWLRQAQVAEHTGEYKDAEVFFLQVLSCDLIPAKRREVMLDMAKLFEESKEQGKQAAVLEKFGDAFPDDPGLPQVFIKLGILYREMALYKLALARFYSVLNYSLKIDQSRIDSYRQISIRAQMEIAETNFAMGEYNDAIKFYSRLRLLELTPDDRAHALFKTGYSYWLLKNYTEATVSLEGFIRDFPDDDNTAEGMFLLSRAYSHEGRQEESVHTVLSLLKRESVKLKTDEKGWIYWQKKAGDTLANQLFNDNDYSHALTIYQAMLELGKEPEWTWPMIYQIGVCFEHLSMPQKAAENYKKILEWPEHERTAAMDDKTLSSVYEMAKWRLDGLSWNKDTNEKLEKLLDKGH